MSLYQKSKAMELGRFTLGSNGSRHNTASIVQVRTLQGSQLSLGEIQYYFKFHVKVSSTSGVEAFGLLQFRCLSLTTVKCGLVLQFKYGRE